MADPWKPYENTYTIHDESRAFTNGLVAYSVKPFSAYKLAEARQIFSSIFKTTAGDVDFDGQVQELHIPSPDVPDGVPVSVYIPKNRAPTPAIWVYFHAGGLILLDRKCLEPALKVIARDAGCIVVNVEYRLLPDQGKGNASFDDAEVVVKWAQKNKEAIGGKPGSKVGVGGCSAGGQIAASLANSIPGLDFQVLIYSNVDLSLSQPSVKEFATCPGLSKADLDWFIDLTIQVKPDYLTDPRFNPMARTSFELCPPAALILQAQLDVLRDSALAYAEKLKAAGGRVRIVIIEGVPHCFFGMREIFKTKCPEAYGHIVHFIKEFQ